MQAAGGTLFLDEICDLTPPVQIKLLRFLQEREFERVGGNETIQVDVRLITATNRDPRELVREGLFREDLFYRLNIVNIELSPLRNRGTDIELLAHAALARIAGKYEKDIEGFTRSGLAVLIRHSWPGNVRELENAIERAVLTAESRWLGPENLAPLLGGASDHLPDALIPGSSMSEIERVAILRTLEAVGGSTSKAAAILGISCRTIQYRLASYREQTEVLPN